MSPDVNWIAYNFVSTSNDKASWSSLLSLGVFPFPEKFKWISSNCNYFVEKIVPSFDCFIYNSFSIEGFI